MSVFNVYPCMRASRINIAVGSIVVARFSLQSQCLYDSRIEKFVIKLSALFIFGMDAKSCSLR